MTLTLTTRGVAAALAGLLGCATVANAQEPLLTLEEAVSLALRDNRAVTDAALEAEKHDFRVSVARSRRLPQFHLAVLAGASLHSVTSTFPAGAFGTYPGTGPIPATEAEVRTPAQFTTLTTGSVDVPLLQQHKIGLGIGATSVAREVALEGVRAVQQQVAADVRKAYVSLAAAQLAVDTARELVGTLVEAQRVTAEHLRQESVLRADAIEIEARLARGRHALAVAENALVTRREQLNHLLGRELAVAFRVSPVPEIEPAGLTLDEARQRARRSRPEIRQAELRQRQAEYDRRLARAEYIPDLSLSLRYVGVANLQVVPAHVTTAGLYLSWEPFDWGRRRNNVAEKARATAQARTGADETRARIDLELGVTYRAWQDAAQLLAATRLAHDAAREQLRVITNKYAEQAVLVRDLLQAQARATESRSQYEDALASYWSALADLRRAMGDE